MLQTWEQGEEIRIPQVPSWDTCTGSNTTCPYSRDKRKVFLKAFKCNDFEYDEGKGLKVSREKARSLLLV